MTVPNIFANQVGPIPLQELDANFASISNIAGNDPRALGAKANGSWDDTSAIQAAANLGASGITVINLDSGNWVITSTITLRPNTFLSMRGATITASCGATPIFQFINASQGLYTLSGTVTGTASCFLFAQGTTDAPTLFSSYAALIHLEGLRINSATITQALQFDKAVNSVFIHGADWFTPSGILASGACVDVTISDSTIFSATGAVGTFGNKLRSTGGTTFFNQGWSTVNSTMDNFELVHDVSDVFVYQIIGGYHGVNSTLATSTGYTIQAQAPTNSNLTDVIIVGGGAVIAGRTRFVASAGGQAYNATIDARWTGVPGTAVSLENNASNITIKGNFKAGSGSAIAVVGNGNNNSITTDVEVDATYADAVVLNGSIGTDCFVDASGPCSGDIVGTARSNVRFGAKVPIHSAGVASLNRAFSGTNLGGGATYAVGVAISTQAVGFARGAKGVVIVHLSYTGANAATQNLQIAVPSGMVLASGTGWAANNNYLGATNGLISLRVPFYCTADGSGNLTVTNQAGNTITIANQGWCGIEFFWG